MKILKDCLGQIETNIIKDVEEYVDISSKIQEKTESVQII